MSALPRPALPAGARRELNDALHDLHRSAGWPSLRTLARQAGCSHTTVSHVFSDTRLPTWGLLELVVEALGGDTSPFHQLWLAASADDEPPTAGRSPVAGPALAGRRTELAVVRRHLEEGSGLLLVSGEPGIGKTRLVSAAVAHAAGPGFVATGSCLPLATEVPLLPVTDALRAVLHRDGGRWFDQALDHCPAFVTASLAHQLPELATRVTTADPDDEWSRQRLFTAVSTLLTALGASRPLALVVEDLQWADVTTLDLIEHLVARGLDCPVVGTLRSHDPETSPRTRDWSTRLRRTAGVLDLSLGPLDRQGTAEQLALLLGGTPPPPSTVDQIHERSWGHPFFTEQLARHTCEGTGPMPRLLADLLDRQLDDLSPRAWQLVRLLAVADRPLPTVLLSRAGGLAADELLDAVRELAGRRLTGEADAADEVRLRHPLLAEAARRRLVPGEDTETHRVLAEHLPGLAGTPAAEVAAHWQAAGDVEVELPWRVRAAQEAAARFAGLVAADHWARVLEIWPQDAGVVGSPPLGRPRAWNGVLDGCDLAGDLDRGDRAARRALEEAGAWQPVDRAELLRRAGQYRSELYDLGGAHRLLDEAIASYRRLPAAEGLVQALQTKSHVCNRQGRHREAVDLLAEARDALETVGETPLRRGLLASIAWQESVTGRLARAVTRMAEVARMAPGSPEPRRDLHVAVMHTDVLLKACRPPDEVETAALPGLSAIETWGLENLRGNLLRANVALAWMRAGRLGRAVEVLVATAPDEGVRGEWGVHLVRARVDCALGRMGLARERCVRLLDRRPAAVDVLAPVMAELAFWEQGTDDAFDPLLRACVAMPNLLIPGEAGDTLVLAARAAAELASRSRPHGSAAGRRRMAARLTGLLELTAHDPFGPGAVPADVHAAPQWHAEIERLLGTETPQAWRAAAAEWDAVPRPHDAAYCRWRGARLVLGSDGEAAGRLLRRAARDAREHEPLSAVIRAADREV